MPVIGTRAQVMNGTADQTSGGLKKKDLRKASDGRIVSKMKSCMSQGNPWSNAVAQARKELGITGFEPLKKGTALYERAMKIYR